MNYSIYIKELINEALAPKIRQSLKQKWKLEVPTLTEPQMDHYINAFEKYKSNPKIVQKDITKYSFHELEHVIDSNFIVKKPQSEISAEPIFQDGTLTVWEGSDQDQCIKIGRGESWCISRDDGSNMYNSYRYNQLEPNFYFIKDSSKSESDPWSFFVLMAFKDDSFGLASRANSSPFTGSEEYSWDEVIRNVPAISDIRSIFKSKPLTTEERRVRDLVISHKHDSDLIKYFGKLSIVDAYIGIGHHLTDDQFVNLPRDLQSKYINTGHTLSTKKFECLRPNDVTRAISVARQQFFELRGKPGIELVFKSWPTTLDPSLLNNIGSLFIYDLESLPENFEFPKFINGSLVFYNLKKIPSTVKFPETITGRVSLGKVVDFPVEVWYTLSKQVKEKIPNLPFLTK